MRGVIVGMVGLILALMIGATAVMVVVKYRSIEEVPDAHDGVPGRMTGPSLRKFLEREKEPLEVIDDQPSD